MPSYQNIISSFLVKICFSIQSETKNTAREIHMMMTWVLVANSAIASLYHSSNLRVGALHLFKEYVHPESRKKVSDLISDKQGHYQTDGGARGAYSKSHPKEVEAEHFAQELIDELKIHCNFDAIKSLLIVAPDGFYKHIEKHLNINHHNQDKISHIAKDYTQYSIQELTTTLKENLFG